jgi:uncharacterized protein
MLLSLALLALDVLKTNGADTPGFDCTKATAAAARMVCADPKLAHLDRAMSELYAAQAATPGEPQRQGAWIARRDDCAGAADPASCFTLAYQQRIAELKITGGELAVLASVDYLCAGELLNAAYYKSDPQAVRVRFRGESVVAFVAESGSGARYTTDGVEIWEHQGLAHLNWHGFLSECTRAPAAHP